MKEAVLRETHSNTHCGGVYGHRFVIGVNTGWVVCDLDPERYSYPAGFGMLLNNSREVSRLFSHNSDIAYAGVGPSALF